MKISFLSLLLVFSLNFNLAAKTVVLSDIDDTLKVAHVHSTWGKLTRAFNTEVVFTGMPQLFTALEESGKVDSFYYLSNAPKKLMGRSHSKFVSRHSFPTGTLWLRGDHSDQEHKLFHLRKLAREVKPTTIILFGDNGEWDSDFYHTFEKEFPSIRMITFIRYLYADGPLAVGQSSFVTALGPYLELQSKGFIKANLKQEQLIARQIIASERDSSYDPVVFPAFLNCPGYEVEMPNTPSELVMKAADKVSRICSEAPFYAEEIEDLISAI